MSEPPDFSDDTPILRALDAGHARLIGYGGEARVYAPDERRVFRLLHPGASLSATQARAAFIEEIAVGAAHLPFATPALERIVEIEGRIVVVERRLPGTPFSCLLAEVRGQERKDLLEAYLATAERIREIAVSRDGFGDLIAEPPVTRLSYRDYLRDRIALTRENAGALAHLMTDTLADAMPDYTEGRLVHFDLFPGNVLMENGAVNAVIDFGATAMIADPRLELWSAVAYLDSEISPDATDEDRNFAMGWLAQRGLDVDYTAARRWIAAYWCFAQDDPKVMAWCRSILA